MSGTTVFLNLGPKVPHSIWCLNPSSDTKANWAKVTKLPIKSQSRSVNPSIVIVWSFHPYHFSAHPWSRNGKKGEMVGLESIWATYVTNTSKANTLLQHPPKMRDSITSSSGAMIWAIVEGDVVIGKRRMNEGKEKERNENRTRERNLSLFSISNSAVRRSIGEHCSAFNLDTPRSSYKHTHVYRCQTRIQKRQAALFSSNGEGWCYEVYR